MALISVIVPVYKVEAYLCRCVDSILAQSFRDFELILVDDGSPDNCGRICDDYAGQDSRIHVIHQKNGGLSAARNTAIDWVLANSDSRWLTFVDSDDWIHENMLEILLSMAREHQVNISVCSYARTGGETPPVDLAREEAKLWAPEEYYISHGATGAIACAKLYRKALFQEIRYPVGKLHEDEYTTYQLLFPEKTIAATELPLYFYFQNDAGIMRSQWSPKRLDALQAIEEQVVYFKKHGFQKAYETIAVQYIILIRQQREWMEESDLPEAEKEQFRRLLTRRIQKAGWVCADVYLRREPYVYMEVFPRLYGLYRRLRGKK